MKFTRDITKFVAATGIAALTVTRHLGFTAYGLVVSLSPVDTGRFRGNNNISLNTIDSSTTNSAPTKSQGTKVGQVPTSGEDTYASGVLGKLKFGDTIIISNNLPYARKLESGKGSRQAPNGVYGPAFDQLRSSLDEALRSGTLSR
jgi:hypothetical protein